MQTLSLGLYAYSQFYMPTAHLNYVADISSALFYKNDEYGY